MLDKIKTFVIKNKTQIIAVLGIILTLLTSLSGLDFGAKVGVIISILIVFVTLMLSILKNGFDETTLALIVKAIQLIQDMIKGKDEEVVSATKSKKITKKDVKMTEDEIRAYLLGESEDKE